jgi:hypothetical protein
MPDALSAALEHLGAAVPRSERLWGALRSLGPALATCPAALERLAPPPEVVALWRRDLLGTRARNLLLLNELEAALSALQAEGIETIVFKGAAALDRLYRDPGARPMDDADLLIRPRDRVRAASVLGRLGYALRPAEPGRFGPVDDALHGEWTFVRSVGRLEVELDLHWHLVADARLRRLFPGADDPDVWARALPSRLGAAATSRISPSDAALTTAVAQPLGHPWSHPLGYLDLSLELADADDGERVALGRRAAELGLGPLLWWSLRFAERLFGRGWGEGPAASAPSGLARRLGEALVGGDWLGLAPFRREMAARDLFVLLLAGPGGLARGLVGRTSAGRLPDPRGTARAALALARAAGRAIAG